MDVAFSSDASGRIVCDICDAAESALVTSSDTPGAALGLLGALADAERHGYGECVWQEGGGEYRWMLRRDGNDVTCVVLWSRGTLTGWQHLLRGTAPFQEFAGRVRDGLERIALAGS